MAARGAGRMAVAVGAIAVLAQAAGIRDLMLWDDVLLLRDADVYTNPARWVESVSTTLGFGATFYWRPLATTSFLADAMLYGGAAWGYRLTSALVHGAISAAAFLLLLRLMKRPAAAALAALCFAVHPVNIEPVTWIAGRFDLLACLFMLCALLAIPPDGADRPRRRWVLAALCTALAACSKENALLLPLIALAWTQAVVDERRTLRPAGAAWSAARWTGAGVLVALFLRLEVVGFTTELKFGRSSVQSYGLTDRVLLVGRSVATYVQTLVAPWGSIGPLHQGVRPIPADDVRGWTGLVLLALVVAATIVTLVRRQRVGWLLAALLVSLAPVIQILPNELPNGVHAADRYAYFPCFFAVAVAGLLAVEWTERHPARARAAGAAAGALAAALLAGRLHVLPRWNDPERFWTWAVDLAPRAPVAQVNLAMTLLEKGDLAGAERHGRAGGWAGVQALALSLERQGRRADARAALDEAILKNPPAPIARMIRGEIELDEGDAAAAMTDFQAAIAAEAAGRTQFAPISPRAAQLMERARAMLAK